MLIADDVEDNRQLLAQLLAPVGFEIRLATNGAEAVQEFEEWRPHLILMDFRMPVMDGHEAIRRIRAMAGGKDPKIIAVTASAMDENRQELLAIGADDFISKPFREAELFQKIHAQVGVEYVYAEEPTAAAQEETAELTPESLARLPRDLIHLMREAVIGADLDQLLARIQEVEARDSMHRPRAYGAWPNTSNTRSFLIYSARASLRQFVTICRHRALPFRVDEDQGRVSSFSESSSCVKRGLHASENLATGDDQTVATEAPVEEKSVARTANILVVDDVSANLQVLTGMLKDRGYKARPVPNGKLALLGGSEGPRRT